LNNIKNKNHNNTIAIQIQPKILLKFSNLYLIFFIDLER